MNMAVNRQAIAQTFLSGKVQPHRVMGYHPQLSTCHLAGDLEPGLGQALRGALRLRSCQGQGAPGAGGVSAGL